MTFQNKQVSLILGRNVSSLHKRHKDICTFHPDICTFHPDTFETTSPISFGEN